MASAWRSSPRDVDLLSWFTGPLVPAVLGGLATAFGLGVTLSSSSGLRSQVLGILSVTVMAIAFVVVGTMASPRRTRSGLLLSVMSIVFGWIALLIAFVGEWDSVVPFELRWSPIGFALLLASISPYVPAARVFVLGTVSAVLVMTATALSIVGGRHPVYWPMAIELYLSSGMILISTVGATVFSYQVVMRTQRWATSSKGSHLTSGVLGESARRRILRHELARVSERALPLLERVTAAGVVTPADRDDARVLAEDLRAELVERSNRSWLDSLSRRMNLTVIDDERLAESMAPPQRSALLGLLVAATQELSASGVRLVIELRGEAGGTTAVAISADLSFPDGRKLTMLAPHYVTLVATVDDVEWDSGTKLGVRFRVRQSSRTD